MTSLFALLCLVSALPLSACGKQETMDPVTKQSFYFDTVCQITVYDTKDMSPETAGAAIDSAFLLCADYENMFSKTIEGSDIWNINHAGGEFVSCDPETIALVEMGKHYGDLSDGKFDITVGLAMDQWDFSGENDPSLPDPDALAEAVQHIDYRKIEIQGDQIRIKDPKGEIDLGGIAKGYIADRVSERLVSEGVTSAIVSLGGNIEVVGGKPVRGTEEGGLFTDPKPAEQTDFNIGIETPYTDMTQVIGASPLRNGTMVTSGVYERFFELDGKEYHHVLNPKTGYPSDSDTLGVTILGSLGDSADCDALATTCLILGSKPGLALIESIDGLEALFILRDGSYVQTDGMVFEPVTNQ